MVLLVGVRGVEDTITRKYGSRFEDVEVQKGGAYHSKHILVNYCTKVRRQKNNQRYKRHKNKIQVLFLNTGQVDLCVFAIKCKYNKSSNISTTLATPAS